MAEAEDRRGDPGPLQRLLAGPARRQVFEPRVRRGTDLAHEDHPGDSGPLGGLAEEARSLDVDLEEGLGPVAADGDQADHRGAARAGLGKRCGVCRITLQHLGAADPESRGRGLVAGEDPELVAGVHDPVGHRAPEEAGRPQDQDPICQGIAHVSWSILVGPWTRGSCSGCSWGLSRLRSG